MGKKEMPSGELRRSPRLAKKTKVDYRGTASSIKKSAYKMRSKTPYRGRTLKEKKPRYRGTRTSERTPRKYYEKMQKSRSSSTKCKKGHRRMRENQPGGRQTYGDRCRKNRYVKENDGKLYPNVTKNRKEKKYSKSGSLVKKCKNSMYRRDSRTNRCYKYTSKTPKKPKRKMYAKLLYIGIKEKVMKEGEEACSQDIFTQDSTKDTDSVALFKLPDDAGTKACYEVVNLKKWFETNGNELPRPYTCPVSIATIRKIEEEAEKSENRKSQT